MVCYKVTFTFTFTISCWCINPQNTQCRDCSSTLEQSSIVLSCVLLNLSMCLFVTTDAAAEYRVQWLCCGMHSAPTNSKRGALTSEVKQLEHEAYNSPQFSAEMPVTPRLDVPPTPRYLANRTQTSTHLMIMWMGPLLKSSLWILDSSLFICCYNPLQKNIPENHPLTRNTFQFKSTSVYAKFTKYIPDVTSIKSSTSD